MPHSDTSAVRGSRAAADALAARRPGILGRRRSFLVNKRYQLRASLLTAAVVLVLLVFINLLLYSMTLRSAETLLAESPELASIIRAQDRVEIYLIVLASFVYLAGVFGITVLETHRTAGAAHNLSARLAEVRDGRLNARLRLRKGDNLRELEGAFNEMTRALESGAWQELETLRQIADEAAKAVDAGGARRIAERLRRYCDDKRSALD